MKKIAFAIMMTLLLISVLTLASNVQRIECSELPEVEWNRIYGGSSEDNAYSVVQTGDGGYAIAGYTGSFNGPCDFWLVKTNSTGHMQWNEKYHNDRIDRARTLIQTDDGGYALAGVTGSGLYDRDFWLVKTYANGTMQWNRIIGHKDGGNDYPYSLIQTEDGGYALAGTKTDSFGRGDLWLVKTNRTGHVDWNLTYGGRFTDMAYSVLQTGEGGYAMAGLTESFDTGNGDFWLIKTDAEGNIDWNYTYGGASLDDAHSIAQTDDGGYALAGDTWSFGAGQADFWLVKTDEFGNMEWNERYGGETIDQAYSVVQTDDWGYALAGYTESFDAVNGDFWLIKLVGDKTPPTTTIDTSGTIGLEGWFVSDVTVTLTAIDDISGVNKTWYRIDETPLNIYQEPFIITTEGKITVYYYSTDNAGNVEEPKSETIKIDKTPPMLTVLSPVAFRIYAAHSDDIYDFMVTDNLDPFPTVTAVVYDFEGNIYSYPSSGDSLPDESGVYRLVVAAADEAGHTSTQEVIFVVYDQSAGFATGGGWIIPEPEEGDCKATFGFVAKYHKDSKTPSGNLEFQYNYGNINLKSTTIEWLVISNNKAIFQGTATINGEGLYTFRVQTTDGDLTGGQLDNFMIKIWEGSDTEADPIHDYKGDLAGGNIKIHN